MISIPLNLYVSAPGSIFPKQVREVSDYICMNFLWDLDSIEVWRAERRASWVTWTMEGRPILTALGSDS